MKEQGYLKFKKMSSILSVVTKVFFWISIVSVIICILGAIVIQFIPEQYLLVEAGHSGIFTLSLDGIVRYRVDSELNNGVSIRPVFFSIFLMASLCSVGFVVVFNQISKILKSVAESRPFTEDNSKRLTIIGVVLLIGSVALRAAGIAVAFSIIDTFKIENIDLNLSVDTFMLLTGLLILILAGIFRYGSYLQQEYDSTL